MHLQTYNSNSVLRFSTSVNYKRKQAQVTDYASQTRLPSFKDSLLSTPYKERNSVTQDIEMRTSVTTLSNRGVARSKVDKRIRHTIDASMYNHNTNSLIPKREPQFQELHNSSLRRTVSRLSLPRKVNNKDPIYNSFDSPQKASLTNLLQIRQKENKIRISLSHSDNMNFTDMNLNADKSSIKTDNDKKTISTKSQQTEEVQFEIRDSLLIYRDRLEKRTEMLGESLNRSSLTSKEEVLSVEEEQRSSLRSILKRSKLYRTTKKKVNFAEHKNQIYLVDKWIREDKLQNPLFKQTIRKSNTRYIPQSNLINIYSSEYNQKQAKSVRVRKPSLQR